MRTSNKHCEDEHRKNKHCEDGHRKDATGQRDREMRDRQKYRSEAGSAPGKSGVNDPPGGITQPPDCLLPLYVDHHETAPVVDIASTRREEHNESSLHDEDTLAEVSQG